MVFAQNEYNTFVGLKDFEENYDSQDNNMKDSYSFSTDDDSYSEYTDIDDYSERDQNNNYEKQNNLEYDNQNTYYKKSKFKPYKFGYNSNDGYDNNHYHVEKGDENGFKNGSYGYTDAFGIYRKVNYIADESGFHVAISTNEPGVKSENPAAVYISTEESQFQNKFELKPNKLIELPVLLGNYKSEKFDENYDYLSSDLKPIKTIIYENVTPYEINNEKPSSYDELTHGLKNEETSLNNNNEEKFYHNRNFDENLVKKKK